jgi:hypothetical protein
VVATEIVEDLEAARAEFAQDRRVVEAEALRGSAPPRTGSSSTLTVRTKADVASARHRDAVCDRQGLATPSEAQLDGALAPNVEEMPPVAHLEPARCNHKLRAVCK